MDARIQKFALWVGVTTLSSASAVAVVTCGGNSVAYCGAGTTPVNGVCVLAEASTDAAGKIDSGAVETDATTGDERAPYEGGPEVAAWDDSPADSLSPVDAREESTLADDPCPTSPIAVNCSTSCGGVNAACSDVVCSSAFPVLKNPAVLPYVARTPSLPASVADNCLPDCSNNVKYSMTWGIDIGGVPNGLLIQVGPPWKINPDGKDCTSANWSGCLFLPGGTAIAVLNIWTDDPNAPARNIVMSAAAPGQMCP